MKANPPIMIPGLSGRKNIFDGPTMKREMVMITNPMCIVVLFSKCFDIFYKRKGPVMMYDIVGSAKHSPIAHIGYPKSFSSQGANIGSPNEKMMMFMN